MADDRTALAEERTDLAEDRTVLAHERSFAGWVRTGLGSVGIALGFNALFRTVDPPWVPRAIATCFLLIAIFIFVSAERRACTIMSQLEAHSVAALRPIRIKLLTYALALITLALIVVIWFLLSPIPCGR